MNKTKLTKRSIFIGLSLFLGACAVSKPGSNYEYATTALRAAEIAGAETYAPVEYSTAMQSYSKAKTLLANNRQDRAQKLLQVAIAQADLAKAISEAEHAETALQQLQASN